MLDLANVLIALGGLLTTVLFSSLAYLQGRRRERRRYYTVEDAEWVEARGYDYVRLLQELVGLDYASVPGLDQEDEGLPTQWAPLFEKSKETWRVVVNPDGMIVAYWSFFFPTAQIVEKIRAGTLYEGHLSSGDIEVPEAPAKRPVYFSMLTTHPVLATNPEIKGLLYSSMVDALDDLSIAGVHVSEIYANAFSKPGRNIAEKMGLKRQGATHEGHPVMFTEWTEQTRAKLLRQAARATAQVRG